MTGNWGGTPVTRHHHPEWESRPNNDPGLQTFLLLYYLVETRLQTIFSVWRAIALIPSNQERRKRKINIGLCTSSDDNTLEVSVRLCRRCCCGCRWEVSSGGERHKSIKWHCRKSRIFNKTNKLFISQLFAEGSKGRDWRVQGAVCWWSRKHIRFRLSLICCVIVDEGDTMRLPKVFVSSDFPIRHHQCGTRSHRQRRCACNAIG